MGIIVSLYKETDPMAECGSYRPTTPQPISVINRLAKYADDATLLVPEKTNVQIHEEFNNITKWAVITN